MWSFEWKKTEEFPSSYKFLVSLSVDLLPDHERRFEEAGSEMYKIRHKTIRFAPPPTNWR